MEDSRERTTADDRGALSEESVEIVEQIIPVYENAIDVNGIKSLD